MYDLKNLNFQELLKKYRKSRNMTLENLGNKIGKTKATISKYENGEIIPDILTVLEICNVLNVSLTNFFPLSYNTKTLNSTNPFNTNILYLYYYTEDILIKSVLEITADTNTVKVKLYNGIKDYQKYADQSSYYYEGFIECDKTIGYINLTNISSNNILLEKLQISFLIPWSKNFSITNFFIMALTPNSIPVIKKGIISDKIITDFSKYEIDLKITQNELSEINTNNAWILKKQNYNHFYFDK